MGALRELRDAGEMLHMQTDVALCERLQPWAEVGAQHVPVQPYLAHKGVWAIYFLGVHTPLQCAVIHAWC